MNFKFTTGKNVVASLSATIAAVSGLWLDPEVAAKIAATTTAIMSVISIWAQGLTPQGDKIVKVIPEKGGEGETLP